MSNKIARPTGKPPAPDARFPDFTPANRARVLELTKSLDRDGPAQRLADAARLSPAAFSAMINERYVAMDADIAKRNAIASASARRPVRRRRWSFAPA